MIQRHYQRTITDIKIQNRYIPAGVNLCPSVYLLHNHPDYWSEPGEYKPERFIVGDDNKAAFIPFGGGIRRRLGHSMAFFQMKVLAIEFIGRFELQLKTRYRVNTIPHGVLYAPHKGMPFNIQT